MFKGMNPLQIGLYYLFKLFEVVDRWIDRAEYEIGNFFDPPKPARKNENIDDWCNRITADQALRYAKFMHKSWISTKELAERVEDPEFSDYKYKRQRKLLKDFRAAIFKVADFNEDLYKRMLLRKQLENQT